jgi:hypothetical protein
MNLQPVFARITKVDERTRIVTGRACQEVVDRDNEVLDYASSKPEFMRWSAEVSADTNGKSMGNLRAMHGNVAAGILTDIRFEDAEKAIDVDTQIIDDNEWKKCQAGVYSGFSIGGRYARKWNEIMNGKMVTKYTAVPSELSLVDRPCVPTAKFETISAKGFDFVKRDGAIEHRDFNFLHAVNFEDGVFVVKGGPGSGPKGGSGKGNGGPQSRKVGPEISTAQARSENEADVHSTNALDHADALGDQKGLKLSEHAHAMTEKARNTKGNNIQQATAHDIARGAHEQAAAYHGSIGSKTASGHHDSAAASHVAAGVAATNRGYGK